MIEGLEHVLEGTGQPGLPELRWALCKLPAESAEKLVEEQQLKSRVFRLRFEARDRIRSLVVKRLDPIEAVRSELAARRWLPAVGLRACGPGLLGVAAAHAGQCVWHLYEDLGDERIQEHEDDAERVAAAVHLIASLHSRFASNPLLAECRRHAESFDITYFTTNVRDALRSLHAVRPPQVALTADQEALRERLLARLKGLLEDEPRRARALARWGGPETLLHGDLWTTNIFVLDTPDGLRPRLIDWDRAGVGPASYDLSTFLLRFPARQRPWLVDLYRRSLEGAGWRLPGARQLNLLFETAELARYANRVIWPALAIVRDHAAWGFEELAAVERWFEDLEPVLPGELAESAPVPAAPVGSARA